MPDTRKSFTTKANGLLRELVSEVFISPAFDPSSPPPHPPHSKFRAIWDTGATNSVVSPVVVAQCQLQPIGKVVMHTANGTGNCNAYLINIVLPNGVGFVAVRVASSQLSPGSDVLIGMNIISQSDFAVTNKNGETWFTFRAPSIERFDFVVGDKYYNEKVAKKRTKPKRAKAKKKSRRKKK